MTVLVYTVTRVHCLYLVISKIISWEQYCIVVFTFQSVTMISKTRQSFHNNEPNLYKIKELSFSLLLTIQNNHTLMSTLKYWTNIVQFIYITIQQPRKTQSLISYNQWFVCNTRIIETEMHIQVQQLKHSAVNDFIIMYVFVCSL